MKVCCDRCEKAMEKGILGNLIGSNILIKKNDYFSDTTIILCNSCYKEFRQFLEVGGKNENAIN